MKVADGRPMCASHPNAEKLMINATFDGPLQERHPKVKKLTNAIPGGPLRARHPEVENEFVQLNPLIFSVNGSDPW